MKSPSASRLLMICAPACWPSPAGFLDSLLCGTTDGIPLALREEWLGWRPVSRCSEDTLFQFERLN